MQRNMGEMMRQARKMQEKMAEVQKGLAEKTVEAASGGGAVKAVVSGDLRLVSIKIDPAAINPSDAEMLEDMVSAAVNEALRVAQKMASDEMGKVTAGINIPGLF